MRFLVIAARRHFVNPTRELFLRALSQHPNFIVVGPGYNRVYQRIDEYSRRFGKFDGVIVDAPIYLTYRTGEIKEQWPDADAETMADMFEHSSHVVVLNLLDDFHGTTVGQLGRLFDPRVVVLSTAVGTENFNLARFRMAAEREHWFRSEVRKLPYELGNNYVLFPAALDDNEFTAGSRHRTNQIAIPGVQYFIRRRAAQLLRKERMAVITGDDWSFRLLRAGTSRSVLISRIYRQRFHRLLDHVKIAVTCSGTVGYPIRKYFEIPARGVALVAEFFDGYESLGFRNGINCLAIEEPDGIDVVEHVRELLSDDNKRRQLAEAGYDTIWRLHRICHRVEQLLSIMYAVADNDFVKARWIDGTLKVVRRSETLSLV